MRVERNSPRSILSKDRTPFSRYRAKAMDKHALDAHTVNQMAELNRAHQLEIAEHYRDFPREKIKNLNGWMMGGIRRLQGQEQQAKMHKRSRSRSRGRRRRRSRSPARREARPVYDDDRICRAARDVFKALYHGCVETINLFRRRFLDAR